MFDQDRDGLLSKTEYRDYLARLGVVYSDEGSFDKRWSSDCEHSNNLSVQQAASHDATTRARPTRSVIASPSSILSTAPVNLSTRGSEGLGAP